MVANTDDRKDDAGGTEGVASRPPPSTAELSFASEVPGAEPPDPAGRLGSALDPTLRMPPAGPPAASRDPAQVPPGTVWDNDFEFVRLLGKGGMGAVHLAFQRSLDRHVAIKVLPVELSGDDNFRRRFALEAKAVAKLNSPNIIQVYTAGNHEGNHYFVMEYVDGRDLGARLRGGFRPTHAQALALVLQAARGLMAAAAVDLVHRDIKPGNMMVTEGGHLKLMDFGLVKLATEETALTQAGTVMGTASYFSPEQGMGETCDARTDIYALGVVFYELITGRLPFTGKNTTAVIFQHIHQPPRPPQEIDPTIPEGYQAVVLKCLQKDPAARYQTAAELVADLERVRGGETPSRAMTDPRGLRTGASLTKPNRFAVERWSQRRQAWLLLLLILVAAGAGAWYWRGELLDRLPRGVGVFDRLRALVEPTLVPATRRLPPAPATGLEQDLARSRTLLEASDFAGALSLLDRLALADLDAEERRTVTDLRDRASKLGEFLRLGDAALLEDDFNTARQNYTAANLVIANAAAGRGMELVTLCATFDRDCAEGRLDQAAAMLARIATARPNPRVIIRRQGRLDAARGVIEIRTRLAAGELAAARTRLEAAAVQDPANRDLPGLWQLLDIGVRETALAAALAAERLDEARRLAGEIAQLDAPRGLAAEQRVVALQADLAERERQAAAAVVAEEMRRAAERRQRQEFTDRLTALREALAAPRPDLAAAATELDRLEQELPGDLRGDLPARRQELARRRDEAGVAAALAALDAAIRGGDRPTVTALVADPAHREDCFALIGREGLTITHVLAGPPAGDPPVAEVALRVGMALAPEQIIRYRYTLRSDGEAWTVAKVEKVDR